MITLNEFENFLYTDLVYEQKIVSVIDDDSKQILIENIRQLHDYTNCTIKLEQMEKYNRSIFQECRFLSTKYFHFGPVTCHAFLAFKDSKSFGLHTDPDDVIIHCISGSKTLYVKDQKRIQKYIGTMSRLLIGCTEFQNKRSMHHMHISNFMVVNLSWQTLPPYNTYTIIARTSGRVKVGASQPI